MRVAAQRKFNAYREQYADNPPPPPPRSNSPGTKKRDDPHYRRSAGKWYVVVECVCRHLSLCPFTRRPYNTMLRHISDP
jgi:hypothetical protein